MTLKNYKRPNGVATQIFDVDLVNYEPAIDQTGDFVVAGRYSSNQRFSAANGSNIEYESSNHESSIHSRSN